MTGRRGGIALAVLLAAGFAVEVAAYWPGIMTWDAAREYAMALGGPIDDWHPPVMIRLWRALLPVAPGPAPMLLLQLALYFAGFASLAGWAWRRERRGLAWAVAAAALFPIPLVIEGVVLKDCLMAVALLCAAGLIADGRGWTRALAVALLLFAATLRFNAFLACLPWLVAALPTRWRSTRARWIGAVIGSALVLGSATPVANRLIDAQPSHVELSQIVFDLGGVTFYSGEDAFPPLPVRDPVAVNARCYSPDCWDPYSWWVAEPCPIGFIAVRNAFARERISPYRWWLTQIARHPLGYAEHRLTHFNRNTRFLVADAAPQLIPPLPDANSWNYAPPSNSVRNMIDAIAAALARTPLGWPIWWIALAAGVLLLGRQTGGIARSMAASALLYGAGYLPFSVATDLRYHLWTMIAALLATFTAGDTLARVRYGRIRLALAAAPVVLVTLVGLSARWLLAGH